MEYSIEHVSPNSLQAVDDDEMKDSFTTANGIAWWNQRVVDAAQTWENVDALVQQRSRFGI